MSHHFSEYPYVNFSEYNYDWLIKKVKEVLQNFDVLNTDFNTLRSYVEDYFANLDLTAEVDAKIDEMIAAGTFSTYINRSITTAINQLRSEQTAALNAYKTENNTVQGTQNRQIAELQGRVDNLVENPPTTSTEVTDVRVAYTGARLTDAGEAVRTSDHFIDRATQQQKTIYGGQNLADLTGWSAGQLTANGTLDGSVSGWFTTGFIPVNRAHGYLIEQLGVISNYTQYRCEYNASQGVVSGRTTIGIDGLPRAYNPSTDAVAFVRFSVSAAVYKDGFVLRSIRDEELHNTEIKQELIAAARLTEGENLIDPTTWQACRLVTGGGVNAGDANFWTCGYIPLEVGKTYELYVPGLETEYSISRTIYDKNYNVISFLANYTAPAPSWEFRALTNYAYVRYSCSRAVIQRGIMFRRKATNLDQLFNAAVGTERLITRGVPANVYAGLDMSAPFNMVEHKLLDVYDMIPSGTTGQAFDTWGRYLFQCCADNTIQIYDMFDGFRVYQLVTGLTFGHGNGCSFFKYGISNRTLAISDISGNIYLYNVVKDEDQFTFTLVRTLFCASGEFGYTPVFCYDNTTQFRMSGNNQIQGYVIGKQEEDTFYNTVMITAINPNIASPFGGKYIPEKLEDTVRFTLPTENNVLQGCKCLNGQIFVTSGSGNAAVKSNICVFARRGGDQLQRVLTMTDFDDVVKDNELEDVAFEYNPVSGRMDMIAYVRTKGYWRYTL
ncbi:MAG: hypothetical protein VZR54_09435 [Ruminococcus sp.]|nr:hypothetical protein [Ruminococcus sp.]